ncbi:MAG: hypothetical protein ABI542_07715 [Gemmatimonadota bacterium]
MSDTPLYESPSSLKTLWQDYRVFADRLEFGTLLGSWTIPFSEVDQIEVHEAMLQALVNGRLDLKHFPFGLKLDMADITEHVALDRNTGLAKRVFFSPEDPTAFVHAAKTALAAWRRDSGPSDHDPQPAPFG